MDTAEQFLEAANNCAEAFEYEDGLFKAMGAVIMYDYDNPDDLEVTTRDLALKQMAENAARMEKYSLASYLFMISTVCDKACVLKGGVCALLDNDLPLAQFAQIHPAAPVADKALLFNLIAAVKARNVELFSSSCATRDQNEPLDPLLTTLLLRLKNTLY